jgi:hypothetical protein
MAEVLRGLGHDDDRRQIASWSPHYCFLWGDDDDHVGTGMFEDRTQSLAIRDRLLKEPMVQLNDHGDRVVNHPDPVGRAQQYPVNTSLYVLPERNGGRVPRQHVLMGTTASPIPDFALAATHAQLLAYRPLYMLARMSG